MIDWGLYSVCSVDEWLSHFDKDIILEDESLTQIFSLGAPRVWTENINMSWEKDT